MRRPDSARDPAPVARPPLLADCCLSDRSAQPFVYDDYHTVSKTRRFEASTDLRAICWHDVTRPVVNFSYAVDRALWGPAPFGFHLTNVLLHMLNVVLLFRLARRLRLDVIPAFRCGGIARRASDDDRGRRLRQRPFGGPVRDVLAGRAAAAPTAGFATAGDGPLVRDVAVWMAALHDEGNGRDVSVRFLVLTTGSDLTPT